MKRWEIIRFLVWLGSRECYPTCCTVGDSTAVVTICSTSYPTVLISSLRVTTQQTAMNTENGWTSFFFTKVVFSFQCISVVSWSKNLICIELVFIWVIHEVISKTFRYGSDTSVFSLGNGAFFFFILFFGSNVSVKKLSIWLLFPSFFKDSLLHGLSLSCFSTNVSLIGGPTDFEFWSRLFICPFPVRSIPLLDFQ